MGPWARSKVRLKKAEGAKLRKKWGTIFASPQKGRVIKKSGRRAHTETTHLKEKIDLSHFSNQL